MRYRSDAEGPRETAIPRYVPSRDVKISDAAGHAKEEGRAMRYVTMWGGQGVLVITTAPTFDSLCN